MYARITTTATLSIATVFFLRKKQKHLVFDSMDVEITDRGKQVLRSARSSTRFGCILHDKKAKSALIQSHHVECRSVSISLRAEQLAFNADRVIVKASLRCCQKYQD